MQPGTGTLLPEDLGGETPSWFSGHYPISGTMSESFGFSKSIKLICVSNRLPSTAIQVDGDWRLKKSTGGLASALSAVENLHMTHIGWPGADVPEEDRADITTQMRDHGCIPVYLTHTEIDQYYGGYSNGVLWPVFHYVTPALRVGTMRTEWDMYVHVNRVFAQAVAREIQNSSDTLVWVHDYHLMLVPQFIRELVPTARIGWFLHTPFPACELFRVLPHRQYILQGLLSANFLAFQTEDYATHFLETCSRLTNLTVDFAEQIVDASPLGGPKAVQIGVTPIGIDPYPFMDARDEDPHIAEKVAQFRSEMFGDRRVILGVDRLDYMKGIEQKLRGYEEFLNAYPEWAGNCVFVQLAVPSRGDVKEYQRLRRHVHELVGEISGKYSNLENFGSPVIYLDQSVQFSELVALYCLADVMLITSLRDGMNLVAFEYIASNAEGMLVLSEFAGATRALRNSGALIVNPWDAHQVADTINQALTMTSSERAIRYEYCLAHVCENTASNWAGNFLKYLDMHSSVYAEIPTIEPIPEIISQSSLSQLVLSELSGTDDNLLVLIDLDTLGELPNLPDELPYQLVNLSQTPNSFVVIISSNSADAVEEYLLVNSIGNVSDLNLVVAAERGSLVRAGEGEWVKLSSLDSVPTWSSVQSVIELNQKLYPTISFTQRTGVSVKWTCSDEKIVSSVTTALRDIVRVEPKSNLVVLSSTNWVEVSSIDFSSVQAGLAAVIQHEKGILASENVGGFKLVLFISSLPADALRYMEEEIVDLSQYLAPFRDVGAKSTTKFVSVSIGGEPGSDYAVESPTDIITILPSLYVDRHVARRHGA